MEISVEALLGTLAAYFAIMAVLAVGTEVVLDILKLKTLKKPISPGETLNELREWVPQEKWQDLEQRVKHMEQVIQEIDATLASTRLGFSRLQSQAQPILKKYGTLTSENVARVMHELEARHRGLAENRLAWIRFLSLATGILWAVLLQLNSLDLLNTILPDTVAQLLGGTNSLWYQVAGLVLSGLGAAAGSSFWHDQMDRLRQARDVVGTVEQLREQVVAITSGIAAGQARSEE